MKEYLSAIDVCRIASISLSSFYRYCKAGLIKPAFFTLGGHRRFSLSHIRQVFGLNNPASLTVAYSGVSSQDQQKDLVSQEQKLMAFAKTLTDYQPNQFVSIKDMGSGLNYKKKGLKQLIALILSGQVKIKKCIHNYLKIGKMIKKMTTHKK